jgi:hypothetical protein
MGRRCEHDPVTRIAIVGGGRAATLHAEAAVATAGVDLVGVGGRPGSAETLAAAAGVPDLPLAELAARADGLVIAVPAGAVPEVVAALPADLPVLVESPVPLALAGVERPRAMTAANLLHAATVKKGLRAIAGLGHAHHLVLRGRAIRRDGASDLFAEPFAGAWPVLLMAAGAPVVAVAATRTESTARAVLTLDDGRSPSAQFEWIGADDAVTAGTELEAAGATGVVTIGLWPTPRLEIDGREIADAEEHPLVALGFAEQIRRFAAMCDGRVEPWPPLSVGLGVSALTAAANRSAAADGGDVATSG